MTLQSQHVEHSFYKLDENNIEMSLDFEHEATSATESVIYDEGSLKGSKKPKNQGIPHHENDVTHVVNFNYVGDDIRHESHGSHQGYRNPQLKEQENVAAARVPQVWHTRPRIQFGLTPRQLNELEDVFEKTKYPNEIIRAGLRKEEPNTGNISSLRFSSVHLLMARTPFSKAFVGVLKHHPVQAPDEDRTF